jgi:hypothetical protein
LRGRNFFIRAVVSGRVAMRKVRAGVLSVLAVVASRVGDALEVERVALVDAPNVFEKRGGGGSFSLHLGRVFKMSLRAPVIPDPRAKHPIALGKAVRVDGPPPDGKLLSGQYEAVVEMIKWHLNHQACPGTDATFLQWYGERAGK